MSSRPRRYLPNWRNRARTVFAMLLVLIVVAIPVSAYQGSNYYSHTGVSTPCDWDATHEHWDSNDPVWDHVGGATGLQYGYDFWCDQTHFEMHWKSYSGTLYWSHYWGGVGVNSGPRYVAKYLYWSDHDVKDSGTWYGFRLYH